MFPIFCSLSTASGKSTYLKQIGIIVLLAHCGSYVPAEYASVPLRTRLCARMGTSDDQGTLIHRPSAVL